jgi:hypothetical protein
VAFPQEIETESSSTVAAHPYTRISRPPLSNIMACTIVSLSYPPDFYDALMKAMNNIRNSFKIVEYK